MRAIREAARLSALALAERAGMAEGTIYSAEKRPPPWWDRLRRLADALQCSADSILGRKALPAVPPDALAAADQALLNAMRADAIAMLGPKLGRAWRYTARTMWLAGLTRIRDTGEIPTRSVRPTPLAEVPDYVPVPEEWFTGWESPRQQQRRLKAGK